MTAPDPNDLRDARVEAAWRAASREEPPPALDDAIRAAARREIGAGPSPIDPQRASASGSLRPQRWWWPLAAAATIGAIAIGLLQLREPQHVGLGGDEKAVVSDTPAAPVGVRKQESDAPTPAQEQAPTAPPATVVPPSSPSPAAAAKPAARVSATPANNESRTREAPAAARALRKDSAPAPVVAQPFPADAAPAAGAVAPPAPAAQAEARPDAPRASEGAAGFASSGGPRRAPAADSAYGRSLEAAGVVQAQATKKRAETSPPRSVPDWIALIRKLRDEGRVDEAAKELAAFRGAYADHRQLLPPDLRSWKPAAP